MPLYEFRCESCGHETETILLFSDPLPTTCEACGGTLKKLLSAPAVQFKGTGFYLTDYGRAGSDASSGGKRKDDGGSGGESKPSGDSKPSGETKASGETKTSGEAKAPGEAKAGPATGGAGSGGDAKPAS